ncbi:MAG TPA: hypothetical protein VHP83_01440 [Aggregatilineaceae bacterium]|nr:hypothetical protein [Aggregatilineaceae bacterium]
MSNFRRMTVILGSVPIITLGLLIVTYAILRAPWPSDPMSPGWKPVSHLERVKGEQHPPDAVVIMNGPDKDLMWYARRGMDGIVVLMLALGYVCVVLALWQSGQRPLMVLTVIGGLGVFYSAFIGLYLGPILTMGGFSLVLFGAGLGWASLQQWSAQTGTTTNETHSTA